MRKIAVLSAALFSPAPLFSAGTEIAPASRREIVTSLEKPTDVRKLEENDMAGYLMVHFKDQTHSAHLAISRDGFSFTDINGGSRSSTARSRTSRSTS